MRSIIIDVLNKHFNTRTFEWLIPQGSLLYITAFVLCLIIFINRSKYIRLSPSYAIWAGLWAIAFGLIGSRIYWLLQHLSETAKMPTLILTGGSGSFGGYLGGIFGFYLSLKLHKSNIIKYLDAASSTMGLGVFFGRLSCFLHGCCFGKITSLSWAVSYPKGSIPYNAQLSEGTITPAFGMSVPVHPVQLYDAFLGSILFIFTSWFWMRNNNKTGLTFYLFWLLWSTSRFFVEFFRGDNIRGHIGLLSTPQFISVIILCVSGAGIVYSLKHAVNVERLYLKEERCI